MATIELSDERAAALKAKAAADGLSLDEWIDRLAAVEPALETPLQALVNGIAARMGKLPPEILATLPTDGASEHDHYIYGWPKKGE